MINLSKELTELLITCLEKYRPDIIQDIINSQNEDFSQEFYNVLRDIVCDELVSEGFQKGILNDYGIKLEILIDAIGRLFMP